MLKFYCFITGDDYKLLMTDTPESKKKVSALATVIFIPVIIWIATGYLMVETVLQGSLSSAIMVALILGALIFLIEKNIIMAHSSRSIVIFRFSLGAVTALLGAVFLDEVIFKQDVDQQMFLMNKITIENNIRLIEDSYQKELGEARENADKKYLVWQTALNDAKHEADGSSGSGMKGVHAITKMKLDAADISKMDYEKSETDLKVLRDKIDSEKADAQTRMANSFNDGALLNRIKALFDLVLSDVYMAIIYFLFTAFLFAMEFLVVFLKSAWPKTNYERRLELIEEIGKERMERVSKNDNLHFESGKIYPSYKHAKNVLMKNTSLYN